VETEIEFIEADRADPSTLDVCRWPFAVACGDGHLRVGAAEEVLRRGQITAIESEILVRGRVRSHDRAPR
jgi:hypothetical protein